MNLIEVASFDVVHAHLSWPWIAFDPSGSRFAFASSSSRIETRVLFKGNVSAGPSFGAPTMDAGLEGFAVDSTGTLAAFIGVAEGASVIVTVDASGEERRSRAEALAGPGFAARAVVFDRRGERLWISAESATETAVFAIDARSHALAGVARSPAFPPPSMHELHVHPDDDAVLLVAACGEDGTFARVARFAADDVEAVASAMDAGTVPAGFVGFSADAARVHLAEADELRTHAWPGLEELSSVELPGDFVSSFAGAVLGERILVDGEDSELKEDAVMIFDRSAIRGTLLTPPVPSGMWAGRLGVDTLVTVEAKGEPARGRVLRIAELAPS
jgi:hypothetical protein